MATEHPHLPIRKFPLHAVQVVCNEGYWEHSEHPHPLVTLDYDAEGVLLAVTISGNDLRLDLQDGDPLSLSIVKGNDELDREAYIADYERSREKKRSGPSEEGTSFESDEEAR